MLNSEINPTRCNNCVYSSQWLYSTSKAIAKNKRNCFILLDLFHYSRCVTSATLASDEQMSLVLCIVLHTNEPGHISSYRKKDYQPDNQHTVVKSTKAIPLSSLSSELLWHTLNFLPNSYWVHLVSLYRGRTVPKG